MAAFEDRMDGLPPDRRALLDLWLATDDDRTPYTDWTGAHPGGADPGGRAPYVTPRTPTERMLTQIWRDVLEVDPVGIDDDYFGLGGDSITAIVIVARAQAAGLAHSTHDLFELRTIRALAGATGPAGPAGPADAAGPAGQPAATPAGAAEASAADYPLTPMQQGMLYHALGDPAGTAYVVQVSCRLDGDVDAGQLGSAVQILVDRHPVLRTSFRWDGSDLRQVVHPAADVPVRIHDWRGRPPDAQRRAVAEHLAADRRRGLDLGRPPLLRVAVLRLADSACVFVLTHHHLLLDGWSQQLLVRELLDVYDGMAAGATGHVAPVPSRLPFWAYLDWIAAQDQSDRSGVQPFWRHRLSGFTPPPADRTSAGAPTGPAVTVPAATAAALADFARHTGVTVSTVLYGGWALVLGGATGTDDLCFGVTVSGRPAELPGASEALGMFINTLPLRVRIPSGEGFLPWLRELQRHQSELTRFQHTPLTQIARCLPTTTGRQLFDSIVVVENFPLLVAGGHASGRLAVSQVRAEIDEGYPVVVEAVPRAPFTLRIRSTADLAGRRSPELLASLLEYVELVAGMVATGHDDAGPPVAGLAARIAGSAGARRRAERNRRLLDARRQPAGPGQDSP